MNFHNRRGLARPRSCPVRRRAAGYVINPKGYGIKAFDLGSAGQVKPAQLRNPDGINLTAYCIGGAGEDYVTIINKAHGADAGDAVVTIGPPGPGWRGAEVMTLAGGQPGDARGATATLGGATITGATTWNGDLDRPARRSARGNQPDGQGHHRRHRQDPEWRVTHPPPSIKRLLALLWQEASSRSGIPGTVHVRMWMGAKARAAAAGYTSLGLPDPRRIPHTPSSRNLRNH